MIKPDTLLQALAVIPVSEDIEESRLAAARAVNQALTSLDSFIDTIENTAMPGGLTSCFGYPDLQFYAVGGRRGVGPVVRVHEGGFKYLRYDGRNFDVELREVREATQVRIPRPVRLVNQTVDREGVIFHYEATYIAFAFSTRSPGRFWGTALAERMGDMANIRVDGQEISEYYQTYLQDDDVTEMLVKFDLSLQLILPGNAFDFQRGISVRPPWRKNVVGAGVFFVDGEGTPCDTMAAVWFMLIIPFAVRIGGR